MSLSYPLTAPSTSVTKEPSRIELTERSVVAVQESPFTLNQTVYVHAGMAWMLDVQLPPMKVANAAEWCGFLSGLNGMEGTFLMGLPTITAPRGTWAGAPKVLGAHAAGVRSIAMDGYTAGATVKRNDFFQTGSGSSTHLHKIVQDATADGSGLLTLEIWPATRAALADNDTFTTSSPKGLWRLAANERNWSIEKAQVYGISFRAMEAL
jgi:hypothetical protein